MDVAARRTGNRSGRCCQVVDEDETIAVAASQATAVALITSSNPRFMRGVSLSNDALVVRPRSS
jgi:hypothetical protein